MSVGLYDKAIVNKIRFWTQDSNVSISDPDTLFTYRADIDSKDKVVLPIISLNRGNVRISNPKKKPLTVDGFKMAANEKKVTHLRVIPISIPYQIDIYTRTRTDNDNLLRELVFKLVNNPKLEVEIPYEDSKYTHRFTLSLQEDIEDNSDVAQHLEKGEYFRTTLNMVVEDAYLFDYRAKDTLTLEMSINKDENK